MVGEGECNGSDAVLAGEGDGAFHGDVGVERADAEVAVPAFDGDCSAARASSGDEFGGGVDVYAAVVDGGGEAGEAIEPVGLDAVAGAFGEDAGAEVGAVADEAEGEVGLGEGDDEIGEGDARHGVMVLGGEIYAGLWTAIAEELLWRHGLKRIRAGGGLPRGGAGGWGRCGGGRGWWDRG